MVNINMQSIRPIQSIQSIQSSLQNKRLWFKVKVYLRRMDRTQIAIVLFSSILLVDIFYNTFIASNSLCSQLYKKDISSTIGTGISTNPMNSNNFDIPTSLDKIKQSVGLSREDIGMPQVRRKLASMGKKGSKQQWKDMAREIRQRQKQVYGVYALHVSKAGGTSLCDLFKKEKCWFGSKNYNCWNNAENSDIINMAPKWIRRGTAEELELIDFDWWSFFRSNIDPQSSCQDITHYMSSTQQLLAMNENWLPTNGLCQDDFHNIMTFRHPIQRLLSHYLHQYDSCNRIHVQVKGYKERQKIIHKPKEECDWFLHGGETQRLEYEDGGDYYNSESGNYDKMKNPKFNVTELVQRFDVLSDNYYMRSLNEKHVFGNDLGFHGKGEEYYESALANLQKFDWIMLLGSEIIDESDNNNQILMEGLGLSTGLPHSRSTGSNSLSFVPADKEYIEELNKYDLRLWKEAQQLNYLDIYSLKQLNKYGGDDWDNLSSSEKDNMLEDGQTGGCCGNVCTLPKNEDTSSLQQIYYGGNDDLVRKAKKLIREYKKKHPTIDSDYDETETETETEQYVPRRKKQSESTTSKKKKTTTKSVTADEDDDGDRPMMTKKAQKALSKVKFTIEEDDDDDGAETTSKKSASSTTSTTKSFDEEKNDVDKDDDEDIPTTTKANLPTTDSDDDETETEQSAPRRKKQIERTTTKPVTDDDADEDDDGDRPAVKKTTTKSVTDDDADEDRPMMTKKAQKALSKVKVTIEEEEDDDDAQTTSKKSASSTTSTTKSYDEEKNDVNKDDDEDIPTTTKNLREVTPDDGTDNDDDNEANSPIAKKTTKTENTMSEEMNIGEDGGDDKYYTESTNSNPNTKEQISASKKTTYDDDDDDDDVDADGPITTFSFEEWQNAKKTYMKKNKYVKDDKDEDGSEVKKTSTTNRKKKKGSQKTDDDNTANEDEYNPEVESGRTNNDHDDVTDDQTIDFSKRVYSGKKKDVNDYNDDDTDSETSESTMVKPVTSDNDVYYDSKAESGYDDTSNINDKDEGMITSEENEDTISDHKTTMNEDETYYSNAEMSVENDDDKNVDESSLEQ